MTSNQSEKNITFFFTFPNNVEHAENHLLKPLKAFSRRPLQKLLIEAILHLDLVVHDLQGYPPIFFFSIFLNTHYKKLTDITSKRKIS